MYHWEADQDYFLIPLRGVRRRRALENHTTGSRVDGTLQGRDDGGAYTVDEAALRHGAGVEEETNDADVAYARFPEPELTRYRDGWLPG
jgi:hypothetical protein